MGAIFKVQAVLALVDQISGPLKKIREGIAKLEGQAMALSKKLQGIANAAKPLAKVGGLIIGAFTAMVFSSLDTEKALTEASKSGIRDLNALENAASKASSTLAGVTKTAFLETAVVVREGAKNLSENTVLGLTDLAHKTALATGAAANEMGGFFAKSFAIYRKAYGNLDDLQFGEKIAASLAIGKQSFGLNTDELARSLTLLGADGLTAGVGLEEQISILGTLQKGLGMDAGQATSMLQKFFQEGAKGFSALGIRAVDAQGKLKGLPDLMDSLQAKFGSTLTEAKKIKLREAFGPQADMIIKLYGNTEMLNDSMRQMGQGAALGTAALDELTAIANTGLGPTIQRNVQKLNVLKETVIKHIKPVITWLMDKAGKALDQLQKIADSPVGKFLVILTGVLAASAVGAFSLASAGAMVAAALPKVIAVVTKLGVFLAGLSWPILLIIGLAAALAAAWTFNLGGIQEKLQAFWDKVKLVFEGISQVFATLDGPFYALDRKLAENLEAAGLLGLVQTIASVAYSIKELFSGLWSALSGGWESIKQAFMPVGEALGDIFNALGGLIGEVLGLFGEIFGLFQSDGSEGAVSGWRQLGEVLGTMVVYALRAVGTVLSVVAKVLAFVISAVAGLLGWSVKLSRFIIGSLVASFKWWSDLISAIATALANFNPLELLGSALQALLDGLAYIGQAVLGALIAPFMAIADFLSGLSLSGIINGLINTLLSPFKAFAPLAFIIDAIEEVKQWLFNIDLAECGAAIINTIVQGIKNAGAALLDSVTGIFGKVRDLLPFSDAKSGPFSDLTASGAAIPATLGQGVAQAQNGLTGALGAVLGQARDKISDLDWQAPALGLKAASVAAVTAGSLLAPALPAMAPGQSGDLAPPSWEMRLASLPAPQLPVSSQPVERSQGGSVTIENLHISLPGVSNGEDFVEQLKRLVDHYAANEA